MKTEYKYRWWYKGRTPEGNVMSLQGHVWATDSSQAGDIVESEQRARWPEVRWMHGKEVEGEGENYNVQFGPTTQQMKATREVE